MTIMAVATDLEEEVSVVEEETIETEITAVINRIRGGRITVEAAIKVEEGIRAEVEEAAITVDVVEVVNHITEEDPHFMTEEVVVVVEEEVATMTEEAVEATDRKRTLWAFTEMIAQTPRWSKSSSTRMKCRQLVLTSTRYEIKFLLPSNLHSHL